MMRVCLIDASGLVVNTILVGEGYETPEGLTLVASDVGNIGDTYAGGVFVPPETAPEPAPQKRPMIWAAAYLVQPNGGAMTGAEEAARIDAIVYYDVGWYAVFFQMPAGVTTYYPRAWNEVTNVHVDPTSRADGYFEIRCKDANGVAIDPENFSVVIDIIA